MKHLIVAVFGLLLLGGQALAAPLRADFSVVASATSSLNGTAFGAPTSIDITAFFDSTTDTIASAGAGLFAANVIFDIDGIGTVNSAPGADVSLYLLDFDTVIFVGLSDDGPGSGFFGSYQTFDPNDVDLPVPGEFSDGGFAADQLPLVVATEGQGNLVFRGIDAVSETASFTAVPAPAALWLLPPLLAGLAVARRRR